MADRRDNPKTDDEALWTPKQVAEFLGCSERTLEQWRALRSGPSFVRLGPSARAAVRYRPSDVRAYVEAATIPCTGGVLRGQRAS